ncbi:hypothetical protein [Nannocystis pusilla]|uniref:Secreted protein n=1 Tax=Nannocystis pusilla TaxID=889268 RepID=A0ABS7TMT1_9BACT|nr:hypothetical protein [Nannocystis pusilla]MBZ5709529.1 hypothetical protein [Nannocystis pusilla]
MALELLELVVLAAVESSPMPLDDDVDDVDASPPLDEEVLPGGAVVMLVLKPDPCPSPSLQAAASARTVRARRRISREG